MGRVGARERLAVFGILGLVFGLLEQTSFYAKADTSQDAATAVQSTTDSSICRKALMRINGRYPSVNLDKVIFSPNQHYPVIIRGMAEKVAIPKIQPGQKPDAVDPNIYDVTIVGGGPAGVMAALRLTERGYKVQLVEQSDHPGGLASGISEDGIESGNGTAYSSGPYGQLEAAMYRYIGYKNIRKKLKILDDIDAFFIDGKLYINPWEDPKVLAELPASFAVLKFVLEWADDNYLNDVELPLGQLTDLATINQFIHQMPQILSKINEEEKPGAKALYQRLMSDPRIDPADPMSHVLKVIQLYSRSALGGTTAQVSATPFSDFYISELGTRYTGPLGAGSIMDMMLKKLSEKDRDVTIKTSATVAKIVNGENAAQVTYVKDGKIVLSASKYVFFAASIKLAPKIIDNFNSWAPERAQMIEKIQMTHYLVHTVRLKGHPYRASYDLWLRDDKYTEEGPFPDLTDITWPWVHPKINAYRGMRDFKKDPKDDRGFAVIYQPLGTYYVGKPITKELLVSQAEHVMNRTKEMLEPYLKKTWGTQLDVELIETQPWLQSIHIMTPGYLNDVQTLRKPLGRIVFANNTLTVPELESSMGLSWKVAEELVKTLKNENKH